MTIGRCRTLGKHVLLSRHERETKAIAAKIGERLSAGAVVALTGELGAGKTTFSQGFAQGLGVKEYVDSPTFSIMKIYEGRLPLYHFDVYRLDESSAEELGLDEYFYGDGVCLVEWPDRIKELLPENTIFLTIDVHKNGQRQITLELPSVYEGILQ
jgi:tRNA threonylcarbamoyladenosine biosynthesis protein TsaE